jgi:Domain of unknown function (DUF4365)
MVNELRDVTGFRGEKILELCLTDYQNFPQPLFRPGFLGDKWPAILLADKHPQTYIIIIPMSDNESRTKMIARRAELLAELFLQELQPLFVAQSTGDSGYDLFVGFRNPKGGVNNILVEVKSTERLARKQFPLPRKNYERYAYSNVPALLIVVDVKENRLYYAWLTPDDPELANESSTVRVDLTEINDDTKQALRDRLVA